MATSRRQSKGRSVRKAGAVEEAESCRNQPKRYRSRTDALLATDPVNGGAGDAVASGQFLAVGGGVGELSPERGNAVGRQLGSCAELDAGRLGAGNAFGGTFFDKVALELTNGGEHVE